MVSRKRKTTVPRQRTTSTAPKPKRKQKNIYVKPLPGQPRSAFTIYETPQNNNDIDISPMQDRFWEAAPKGGRPTAYESSELLFQHCIEYIEWVHEHPFKEARLVSHQGSSVIEWMPKPRVMTIAGLCCFLGIIQQTWTNWQVKDHKFLGVCQWMNQQIYNQKFSGASSGFFNASIIARDLGLADKQELTGRNGSPLNPSQGSVIILPGKVPA